MGEVALARRPGESKVEFRLRRDRITRLGLLVKPGLMFRDRPVYSNTEPGAYWHFGPSKLDVQIIVVGPVQFEPQAYIAELARFMPTLKLVRAEKLKAAEELNDHKRDHVIRKGFLSIICRRERLDG